LGKVRRCARAPVDRLLEIIIDWTGLSKERIELGLPLLIIKGAKGFLACGYVNAATCDKTGEACAIVTGVRSHDDMLAAPVQAVSREASKLSLRVGMTGREALEILR